MRASSGPEATRHVAGRPAAGAVAVAVAMLVHGTQAAAAEDAADKFGLTAAVGLTSEDNVFRLSDAAGPDSDTYRSISAGLRFDVPFSGQRIRGEATGSDLSFRRFEELDHQAWRLAGAWLWQAGSRLDGRVGYSAESVLSSLANLRSGAQSAEPNHLRIQRFDAEGGLSVGTRWRLNGAVERIEHENDSAVFESSDMTREGGEATLTYLSASGNSIGAFASYSDATLPNLQAVGILRVDNSYRQHRLGGVFEWVPTAKSRFNFRGGYVARDFRQFPQRDLSTWTGMASYDWRPTAKFSMTVIAQRDLSEWEQVNVGYVLARGIALRPALEIGQRTQVALNLETSQRVYGGDVGLGPVSSPGVFRENLLIGGITVDYRITPAFGLRLLGRHEARRASSAAPEYSASIVGVELRAAF